MSGTTNGKGSITVLGRGEIAPPPDRVNELARACVEFVRRATISLPAASRSGPQPQTPSSSSEPSRGLLLDYTMETLPLLDHYISSAREPAKERPEALPLLAHAIGAYFGEVVRRRHASWWKTEGDDPSYWKVELEDVYLALHPVQLAVDAMRTADGRDPTDDATFELLDEDRDAVAQRLADLPQVSEEEYYSLSTRLEVVDIAVEAIRARRIASGDDAEQVLTPDDYDD